MPSGGGVASWSLSPHHELCLRLCGRGERTPEEGTQDDLRDFEPPSWFKAANQRLRRTKIQRQ